MMQPGTEDIGPEDLTGISTVMWHESFYAYVPQECKTSRGEDQREALARCRMAAMQSNAERRMRGEFVK